MVFLYALARPLASSLTTASSSTDSSSFDPITSECININVCRTTTGIIWSCLSVIFICTWVAVNPNIPLVQEEEEDPLHPAVVLYHNVELMVVALVAPEFIILWAMRQREQAKNIRKMFKNNYGWGMAHGFFVIMGGFALYDGEKFCGYLWDRDRTLDKADHEPTGTQATSQTLSDGDHHKPFDGKAEKHFGKIKAHHEDASAPDTEKNSESSTCSGSCENLSTADASETGLSTPLEFLVSKGYITLTENEIKDRSHADFIAKSVAVIQTTWFILQVIARAVQGLAITELEIMTVGFAILNFGTYFLWWNKPLRVGHPTKVYWRLENMSGKSNVKRGKRRIWSICKGGGDAIVKYIYKIKPPSDSTIIRLLLLPIWIPLHIFFVCLQILRDNDNKSLAFPISSRLKKEPGHLYIAVYGAAALFGAIHCIPWVFQFLTHTEQSLWRISAIAVAAAPIAVGPLHAYMSSFDDHPWNWKDKGIVTLVAILSLAYAAFRIILIVIAFTSLRYLPPGAYQTVQWTTFIPHVG